MSRKERYSEIFNKALEKEFSYISDLGISFLEEVEAISEEDLSRKFEGKNKVWLSKEVSKWKRKVKDNTFNPTLQNLYIFCTMTGLTPNDVLLENKKVNDAICKSDIITFLELDEIEGFVEYIKSKKDLKDEKNKLVPLFYAPDKMVIGFFSINTRRIDSRYETMVGFYITTVDAEEKGTLTMPIEEINITKKYGLNHTSGYSVNEEIKRAYEKTKRAVKDELEQLENVVHDFYKAFLGWVNSLNETEVKLLQYFPMPDEIKYSMPEKPTRIKINERISTGER